MIKKLLFICAVLSFSATRAQFSGNALDFDGSNDLVDVAAMPSVFANPATSDFTIEAWVNPRGSVFARILFAQASTSNFVSLGTNTGNTIYFYVIKNGTTISVATTASIPQNQWTHVAARWNSASSVAEVFFNGVLQAGVAGGSSSTGTSGLMTIGARTGGSQFFNGKLDELRVWGTALTVCEIQANMNNTIPTVQPNLIMNYNFNQGIAGATNTTVTALPDLSGSAYHGSLSNFVLTGATSNWVSSTASLTASGYSNAAVSVSAAVSYTNISCHGANNGVASVSPSGTGPFTYTWMPAGGNASTASGLSAGVYSVVIANTCASTTYSLNMTEAPAIVLNATAGGTAICAGSTSTLTAIGSGGTGTLTYTWSTGISSNTIGVSPASTTVYTVNATDANNCAKSATVNVTVNALPSVSLTASTGTACTNSGSVALTGSPAGGAYTGTNVSGTAFTPATSGTFTPAYSFTNSTTGCSNTATTAIVVSLCTGIETVDGAASATSLYPNPGNGVVTIGLSVPSQITVTNMIGNKVLVTGKLEAGSHSLDLSGEANGVYFVQVTGNGTQSVIKLVKQ